MHKGVEWRQTKETCRRRAAPHAKLLHKQHWAWPWCRWHRWTVTFNGHSTGTQNAQKKSLNQEEQQTAEKPQQGLNRGEFLTDCLWRWGLQCVREWTRMTWCAILHLSYIEGVVTPWSAEWNASSCPQSIIRSLLCERWSNLIYCNQSRARTEHWDCYKRNGGRSQILKRSSTTTWISYCKVCEVSNFNLEVSNLNFSIHRKMPPVGDVIYCMTSLDCLLWCINVKVAFQPVEVDCPLVPNVGVESRPWSIWEVLSEWMLQERRRKQH